MIPALEVTMSRWKTLFAAALLAASLGEAREGTVCLKVDVTGLKSDRGSVRIALYGSEADFLKTSVRSAVLPIQGGRSSWQLEALPPGEYAVAVVHDENGNGKTDRGAFGIPTEPFAFSNGARVLMGPPKWQDARFALRAPATEIEVRLK